MADATGIREYKGGAVPSALSAAITNLTTSFSLSPVTNWPTGAGGQFTIVIDLGLSSEESILCSAQSSGVVTVVQRGYDSTTAVPHNINAVVYHAPSSIDVAEANYIVNTHSQTSKVTPVDADELGIFDSAATFGLKKLTIANLKALVATYLASLTQIITNKDLSSGTNIFPAASVTPSNAIALSNKDFTSPTNTFPAQSVAGKNALINGGMDFWNRGVSISNPSSAYFADRWWAQIGGGITFSQESAVIPLGSRYSMKILSAAANTFNINQVIETSNAIQYAGKNVTLSAQTQSSIVMPLQFSLYYSTVVDNAPGGAWTIIAPTSGGTYNSTIGALTQNNAVYAVPATAKSLMVLLGTNGAPSGAFTLYYGNVQLELGSVPTSFSRAGGSIGGEDILCQRYLPVLSAGGSANADGVIGYAYATNATIYTVQFPVKPRVPPTGIVASGTINAYALNAATATTFSFNNAGATFASVTAAPTITAGQGSRMSLATGAYILFTGCEL